MDRFIARAVIHTQIATMYLKSNMDRFIVPIGIGIMAVMIFKIQYG